MVFKKNALNWIFISKAPGLHSYVLEAVLHSSWKCVQRNSSPCSVPWLLCCVRILGKGQDEHSCRGGCGDKHSSSWARAFNRAELCQLHSGEHTFSTPQSQLCWGATCQCMWPKEKQVVLEHSAVCFWCCFWKWGRDTWVWVWLEGFWLEIHLHLLLSCCCPGVLDSQWLEAAQWWNSGEHSSSFKLLHMWGKGWK